MNKTIVYKMLPVVIILLMLAGIASAGELQQQLVQESTIEKVLQKGVLRVGMDTFVPWAMRDKTGS